MAPKKKGNKNADDDWEPEAETASPALQADIAKDAPSEADAEDEFPAGGLMAMMRKKQKKGKKGKADELVEGEDPIAMDDQATSDKAPIEASIDDEFTIPDKKNKSKGSAPVKDENGDEDERGADGKVLTKAQKEKLKKEREKQRKKENVG